MKRAITTGLALAAAALAVLFPDVCAAVPRVVRVDPSPGAKDVRTSSNIRVEFDSVMDAATITTSTVLLDGRPLSETPGAAVVHPEGTSVVLLVRLVPNNVYRFTMTTAVRDSGGAALADPYSWDFVTASRLDEPDTPVRIFGRYPRMNEFGIPTNAPVTMTFTTEMDAASFGPDSIIIRKTTGGEPVSGKLVVQGRRVILRPKELLAANQPYEAVVSSGVKSRWGGAMERDGAWQFATGDGPAEGPVITDCWYESYGGTDARRMVLHAAVEMLLRPDNDGRPAASAGAVAVPEGSRLMGALLPLTGLVDMPEPSSPLGDKPPQITGPDPSKNTVVVAAYTHGGGAGQGNSVDGNTEDPEAGKRESAARAALSSDGAVKLEDSGDVALAGDAAKADGVYSARLTLDDGVPGGPALVVFAIGSERGRRTADPVCIPTYIQPPSSLNPAHQSYGVLGDE